MAGAGFKLIFTVRNSGGPREPAQPPEDLSAYKERLGRILEQIHPEFLVIENEENADLYYSGTPEDYATQLKAAVEVALI